MKLLFTFAFLFCFKESEGQKKLSVKQIDSVIHTEKNYRCIAGKNLLRIDSSVEPFKVLYCLDRSTKVLQMAKVFLNDKDTALMQYKYFFINDRIIKVEFLLKGSCNCFGEYYFNNDHLLYKKEKNIEVQNTEALLKTGYILITNAKSQFKK